MGFDFIGEEDFGDAVEVNQGVVSVVHNGLVRWRWCVNSLGGSMSGTIMVSSI